MSRLNESDENSSGCSLKKTSIDYCTSVLFPSFHKKNRLLTLAAFKTNGSIAVFKAISIIHSTEHTVRRCFLFTIFTFTYIALFYTQYDSSSVCFYSYGATYCPRFRLLRCFPRFPENQYLKIAIINYNRSCYKLRHKTRCRQRDYKNLIFRFAICCLADVEMSRTIAAVLSFLGKRRSFVVRAFDDDCCVISLFALARINKNFNFFFSLITPCINVKATVLSLVLGQP